MFEKIISNPLYALGLLVFLIIVGWFLFVKLFPLNDIRWKNADFLWLSLSALGLIGLLAENRMAFGERDLYQCNTWIDVVSRDMRSDLNSQLDMYEVSKNRI